jgi:hypothetical protein
VYTRARALVRRNERHGVVLLAEPKGDDLVVGVDPVVEDRVEEPAGWSLWPEYGLGERRVDRGAISSKGVGSALMMTSRAPARFAICTAPAIG